LSRLQRSWTWGSDAEDVRADQLLGLDVEAPVEPYAAAQRLERQEVRVHPAPSDHVTARGREIHLAEAGQQRTGEEQRRTDLRRHLPVHVAHGHTGRVDAHGVRPGPDDLRAERLHDLEQVQDVADPGDVPQNDRLGGEQTGGDAGEGGVLVAGRANAAGQDVATLDDESGHLVGGGTSRTGTGRARNRTPASGGPNISGRIRIQQLTHDEVPPRSDGAGGAKSPRPAGRERARCVPVWDPRPAWLPRETPVYTGP
jgi:hypothetical protein